MHQHLILKYGINNYCILLIIRIQKADNECKAYINILYIKEQCPLFFEQLIFSGNTTRFRLHKVVIDERLWLGEIINELHPTFSAEAGAIGW